MLRLLFELDGPAAAFLAACLAFQNATTGGIGAAVSKSWCEGGVLTFDCSICFSFQLL